MIFDKEEEKMYREKNIGKLPRYEAVILGMGTSLVSDPYPNISEADDAFANFLKDREGITFYSYRDSVLECGNKNILFVDGSDRIGTGNIHLLESRFIHSPANIGIGVGYCGTPDPSIEIGDYLIVEQADVRSCIADELNGKFINLVGGESSPRVIDALYKTAKETGKNIHRGKTITVQDFDSSNNPDIIKRMRRSGFSGIDMETAYNLQTVDWHNKRDYQKEFGMILLVSDNQAKACDTTVVSKNISELGKIEIGKLSRVAIEAALLLLE